MKLFLSHKSLFKLTLQTAQIEMRGLESLKIFQHLVHFFVTIYLNESCLFFDTFYLICVELKTFLFKQWKHDDVIQKCTLLHIFSVKLPIFRLRF